MVMNLLGTDDRQPMNRLVLAVKMSNAELSVVYFNFTMRVCFKNLVLLHSRESISLKYTDSLAYTFLFI